MKLMSVLLGLGMSAVTGAAPIAAEALRFNITARQTLYALQASSSSEVELKSCQRIPAPSEEKVSVEIPIKKTPQYPYGEGSWRKDFDLKNLYFTRQIPFFIHASYREEGLFLILRTSDVTPGSHGGTSEIFFKNPPENGKLNMPHHSVNHRKLSSGCLEKIEIELGAP